MFLFRGFLKGIYKALRAAQAPDLAAVFECRLQRYGGFDPVLAMLATRVVL